MTKDAPLNFLTLNPIDNLLSKQAMMTNINDTQTEIVTELNPKLYKRKHKRLTINQGKLVQIIFNQKEVYSPCQGMILNDSFDGCALLLTSDHKIDKGQRLLILMNNIEPIKAEVIWSRNINNTELEVGIKYIGSKTLKMKLFFQKTNPDNC
ncbi:hypothetical protein WH8501_07545 [Crocosphaera watsonii WH 8501]|uniref:hypothetical protein n=1 Tax=Crocosphaera watsonii TaxID=263511 RepID=UPI0005B26F47|nr:hypothetical protein [Crocosphaera watsonii]